MDIGVTLQLFSLNIGFITLDAFHLFGLVLYVLPIFPTELKFIHCQVAHSSHVYDAVLYKFAATIAIEHSLIG